MLRPNSSCGARLKPVHMALFFILIELAFVINLHIVHTTQLATTTTLNVTSTATLKRRSDNIIYNNNNNIDLNTSPDSNNNFQGRAPRRIVEAENQFDETRRRTLETRADQAETTLVRVDSTAKLDRRKRQVNSKSWELRNDNNQLSYNNFNNDASSSSLGGLASRAEPIRSGPGNDASSSEVGVSQPNQQQQQIVPAANPSFEAAFQGECSRNNNSNNPCDHICLDLHDGTYECSCFYGFALAVDGYSCTQLTNPAEQTVAAGTDQPPAQAAPTAEWRRPPPGNSTTTTTTTGGDVDNGSNVGGGAGGRGEQEIRNTGASSVLASTGPINSQEEEERGEELTTTATSTKTLASSTERSSLGWPDASVTPTIAATVTVSSGAPDAAIELMYGNAIGPPWPVLDDDDDENDQPRHAAGGWQSNSAAAADVFRSRSRSKHSSGHHHHNEHQLQAPSAEPATNRVAQATTTVGGQVVSTMVLDRKLAVGAGAHTGRFKLRNSSSVASGYVEAGRVSQANDNKQAPVEIENDRTVPDDNGVGDDDDGEEAGRADEGHDDGHSRLPAAPTAGVSRFYRRRQDLASHDRNRPSCSESDDDDQDVDTGLGPSRHKNSLTVLASQQDNDEENQDDNDKDDERDKRTFTMGTTTETKSTTAEDKLVRAVGAKDERTGRPRRRLVYQQHRPAGRLGKTLRDVGGGSAADDKRDELVSQTATLARSVQRKRQQHGKQTDDNRIDPRRWVSQANSNQLEEDDDNEDDDDDDDVDEDDDDYELEEPQQQQEMEEKLLGSDNLMIARTRSINRWTPPHKNTKRLLAADPAGAAASQAGLESTIANDKDEKGASGDVGGNAKGWRKNESINPNSIIWSQQDRLLDAGPPGDHEPRGASKLDDDDAKNEIIGPDWTPTKTSYPGDGASSDEDEDEEEDDDDEEEEEVDLDKTLVDFDKTTDDDQRRRPMRRLSASERRRRLDYDLGLLESLVGKTMDDMPSP